MSETKFTPGEWHVEDGGWIDSEADEILYVYGPDNHGTPHVMVAASREEQGGGIEANANLIAAAPEMYDELEDAIKDLKFAVATIGSRYPDRAMKISKKLARKRTLLAKARGDNQGGK